MKKILFFALALVAGVMSMNAQTALDTTQVDGIWYILDKTNHTATVTYGPATGEAGMWGGIGQDTYNGRLIIPEGFWTGSGEDYADYTVTAIGDNAFAWCNNLTGITIPKTVRTLGLNLLQRSGNVTELKIEDGEEPIYFRFSQGDAGEEFSFQELAYSCTYLYLGRNVEQITTENYPSPVFHTWNAVQTVVIGEKVTELPLAFCPYCRNLQSVQINKASLLEPGPRTFAFLEEDKPQPDASLITLYVPEGLGKTYQAHTFWGRFNIQEMDQMKQYGIQFASNYVDFYQNGLYYQVWQDQNNPDYKYPAVVIPQVWYLNPDGSYVSTWSSEFPYKQSSIVIPDSVTFYSFTNSSGTKYSAAPLEGWTRHRCAVEAIGDYCFRGASNLSSLTIPSTVKYIGTEAFEYTDKLFSLDIPESVEKVGWLAFARTGLKEVVIPASSSNWLDSNAAFQDNANLTKVTFAQGTTAIQDRIFFGCVALRTIIIPDEVIYIGPGAFAGCEALTEIHLPASLQVLNNRLFRGCPLRSLEIPAGVIEIEGSALLGTNIAKLTVNPANTVFDSRDNCNAIIRTADNTLVAATDGAFIPATVDSIAQESFNELYGIRSLTLPKNLKRVSNTGLMNLENLTLITSYIETPAGVLESGAIEDWYRNDLYGSITIYVPAGTKTAYQADEEWGKFKNIVEMEGENKPADVADLRPVTEDGAADFSKLDGKDLSDALVGNMYVTCDLTNGDHYDKTEQALILNTVGDQLMLDNIAAHEGNMDILRNNFSGIVLEIPAGKGTITIEAKVKGDRALAVYISGHDGLSVSEAPATKTEINIPFDELKNALVYIFGIFDDGEALPAPQRVASKIQRAPAASEDDDLTAGTVNIYSARWTISEVTDVEQTEATAVPAAQKVVRDGKVFILRDGKTYSLFGSEVQ